MNIEKTIKKLLATTTDEILGLSGQEMDLQLMLKGAANQLNLSLLADFPTATLQSSLLPALAKNLQQALPSYSCQITAEAHIRPHRTQLAGKGLRGVKNTIAIASGKGGVGKSTVAVNLAIALARAGARVGILDADIYGPSIPLMLGKTQPVAMKGEQYIPVHAHGIDAMSIGYLTDNEQALIWRGPMLAKALLQMLTITVWDNLDYLFIDLPPGTGDIQLSLVQKIPLTGAIIVTTPQDVATVDARKGLAMFAKTGVDVLGLIENMAFYQCSQCHHQDAIFGSGGGQKLSEAFQLPLIGQFPLASQIGKECDDGTPTAAKQGELAQLFMKTALHAAIILAKKPYNYADKFPDVVVE